MFKFKIVGMMALTAFAMSIVLVFDAVTSSADQNIPEKEVVTTAALSGLARTFKDPYTGMEFVFIKGGCYEMGDTFGSGNKDEKPSHKVCVDDFYLGIYEVTQGQWEKVMGNNPSSFKKGNDYPVDRVSWEDVEQFIHRLNSQTGRKYRLPTEAEWEYAARSGGKQEKYAGTNQEGELEEYVWYVHNSDFQTHPVGQKRPNGLGLYDMLGNVSEWCADWYDENYYEKSPADNPKGPDSGTYRVLRGVSYLNDWYEVRVSIRAKTTPSTRMNLYGFRLGFSAQ